MQFTKSLAYSFNKSMAKVKGNAPEIMIAGAVVCTVGSIVAAIFGTRKAIPIIEQAKEDIEVARAQRDEAADESKKAATVNLMREYGKAGVKVAYAYLPTIGLGLGAIGLMLGSNHIARERYAGMAAAYTAVDGAFQAYKQKVKERFGEEAEAEIAESQPVQENVGEGEIAKPEPWSDTDPYAALFDETTTSNAENRANGLNKLFLCAKQEEIQRLFERRAHSFAAGSIELTLFEVYAKLGISPRNRIVSHLWRNSGWTWTDGGDNHIDLGFESDEAFMACDEQAVWLHPNCSPLA